MAIEPVGPIFGHVTPWTIIPATRGHQTSSASLSLSLRGILSIPPCTPYSRLQEWCIYGIIYHYAPFFLSNSMMTFSGPNPTISNQGPKIQCPWRQSEDHSRIPITWPCRSLVAISFRIIPRAFSDVIQYFNQLSRHQVFQYSLDNSIGPYRRQSRPNWANPIFHCGNSITQFNFKMVRTVLAQFVQYSQ
ncbi:hypothetical protein O181_094108 [Austropuccinia psidii MF-1]|uniref:Uncharacterized protein n=1 Tax=Austropuccinia psidii MF-1 TaxID=1389203 RepID=A0A9Q3J1H0_9BASI|nr:hypothetical protein [Austropuccinia psidii MF-1]